MKLLVIPILLLGIVFHADTDSFAQDVYEENARWWKERQEKKPIARNKDGSRKGYFCVQFNPNSVPATEGEESGPFVRALQPAVRFKEP